MKAMQLAELARDDAYLGKIRARAQQAQDKANPSEQDKAAVELVELSKARSLIRGLGNFMAQMRYLQAFEAYAERYLDKP